jgi:hypothetical protein
MQMACHLVWSYQATSVRVIFGVAVLYRPV